MLNGFQKGILVYIGYIVPQRRFRLNHTDLQRALKFALHKNYSLGTLRKETSKLRSAGLITNKLRYHKPVPVLSVEGRLKIAPNLPYKSFGDWDNLWRIVFVRTPNSDRRDQIRFTDNLIKLGFKKVQKNVFISPHALLPSAHRIATYLGIRQHCLMFETHDLRSHEQVIEKVWNIDEIGKRYKNFMSIANISMKNKKNRYWPFTAKKLEQSFIDIYTDDPHLPQELLPASWPGAKAYNVFKKISRSY